MNVTTLRAFSTTASKNALKWAGATKQDIINLNPGKDGAQVVKALEDAEAEAEEKVSRPLISSIHQEKPNCS